MEIAILIVAVVWMVSVEARLAIYSKVADRMLRSMHERLEALEGKTGRYAVVDDPIDGKPTLEIDWKGEKT